MINVSIHTNNERCHKVLKEVGRHLFAQGFDSEYNDGTLLSGMFIDKNHNYIQECLYVSPRRNLELLATTTT
jgi:hypothetical protein